MQHPIRTKRLGPDSGPRGGGVGRALTACLLGLVLAAHPVAAQSTGTVSGLVRNGLSGGPLAAVQIDIPRLGIGALTSDDGRFLIGNVPAGSYTLRASIIGFGTGTVDITVTAGQTTTVNVTLSSAAINLDEILVTGTAGAARRREVGNSISSVNVADLDKEVVLSTQDILTGTTSGLQVNMNGGEPGSGGSIRIRGVNSMTQGNRPLIYIDGVRMDNSQYPGSVSNEAASPLDDINPNDIERMEVIKGAAATTLYGTEAAGGVIQIFTKQGSSAGSPAWEFKTTLGALHQGQIGPTPTQSWFDKWGPESKSLFMDQYMETGFNEAFNLSVRGATGGGQGVTYFVSGGWSDESGVLPNQSQRAINVRGNLGFEPAPGVTIQFNNSLTQRDISWIPLGNLAKGFSLNVFRGPFDYVQDQDTVFLTQYHALQHPNHFTSGLNIDYVPSDHLRARVNLGLDYLDDDYEYTEDFASLLEPTGVRRDRRWQSATRTLDVAATYTQAFGSISTSTSGGFQMFQNRTLTVDGNSTNFSGPGSPTLNTGSSQTVSEDRLAVVNAGVFIQELIGFSDQLFVTAGLRVDGNSAFGSDYGRQLYPKVSASYVISDSDWWPDFMEMTKLRMAYGESGKAPGYFDAVRTWTPTSALEGQPGVTPLTQGNPDLGPERTGELEAGIEISALSGRLSLDMSVYKQKTVDALIRVPQDPSNGYLDPQIKNVGSLENKGFEATINASLYRSESLEWDLDLIGSFQKSEALDLGPTPSIFLGGSLTPGMFGRVGYPLPSYFGPVVQNPDEKAAPQVEEEYLGPMYPTRLGTIGTSVRIGQHLTATARAEYQAGHVQLSHTAWRNTQRRVWPPCFDVAQKYDAGQVADLTARERWQCGPGSVSSWAAHVYPLDFLRLREVALNYQVPEEWTGGYGRWTVSVGGRNLAMWTKYKGVDPEVVDDYDALTRHEYYQMPVPKSFTFTVRTTF